MSIIIKLKNIFTSLIYKIFNLIINNNKHNNKKAEVDWKAILFWSNKILLN